MIALSAVPARPIQTQATQPARRALPLDRRGRLRNGARPGDFLAAPRCGARTRAKGCCAQPAMVNGRCRFHGGKSTGPRTAEGRLRCRQARLRHGGYAAEVKALRREASVQVARLRAVTALIAGRATPEQAVLCSEIAREMSAARRPHATAGHGVLCSQVGFPAPTRPHSGAAGPVDPWLPRAALSPATSPVPTAGHGVLCSHVGFPAPNVPQPCNHVGLVYSPPPPCRPRLGVG